MEYRLAIIGFGNVGQGFAEILRDHGLRAILEQFGARFRIVGVSDNLKGSIHDPAGFEPGDLLDAVRPGRKPRAEWTRPIAGGTVSKWLRRSSADVVVELSYTDLETGEPATTDTSRQRWRLASTWLRRTRVRWRFITPNLSELARRAGAGDRELRVP